MKTDRVAPASEGEGSGEPVVDFMRLSLRLTADCPPLDDSKTDKVLGPGEIPTVPEEDPSIKPTGDPGDRLPVPADPPVTEDSAPPVPDGNLLEPVPLTKPEICYADKFAAHVTTALKGTGEDAAEVRTALNRAGYPDELIVNMKSEGGSPACGSTCANGTPMSPSRWCTTAPRAPSRRSSAHSPPRLSRASGTSRRGDPAGGPAPRPLRVRFSGAQGLKFGRATEILGAAEGVPHTDQVVQPDVLDVEPSRVTGAQGPGEAGRDIHVAPGRAGVHRSPLAPVTW